MGRIGEDSSVQGIKTSELEREFLAHLCPTLNFEQPFLHSQIRVLYKLHLRHLNPSRRRKPSPKLHHKTPRHALDSGLFRPPIGQLALQALRETEKTLNEDLHNQERKQNHLQNKMPQRGTHGYIT